MTRTKAADLKELVEKNKLIQLDIGCGASKQPGFVGIDMQELPGVDVVHNLQQFPWPLPDGCARIAVASHVLEHISPTMTDPRLEALVKLLLHRKLINEEDVELYIGDYGTFSSFLRFMDEVWRILAPEGQFVIGIPYGLSYGFVQDPTHCNPINETTWSYFDPEAPSGFYRFYQPKPWKIQESLWNSNGNMEVVLVKRPLSK